ncbi:uncharacterized protein METZ01_LOCUS373608, partial [marine metagenome]
KVVNGTCWTCWTKPEGIRKIGGQYSLYPQQKYQMPQRH